MLTTTPFASAAAPLRRALTEQLDVTLLAPPVALNRGHNTYTYALRTTGGMLVVKLFKSDAWPEPGKLPWLARHLDDSQVRVPPLLFYSRDLPPFPHGLAVYRHVAGTNGLDAIQMGQVPFFGLHRQLAEQLRRVQALEVARYGLVNGGQGTHDRYTDYVLEVLGYALFISTRAGRMTSDCASQVAATVERLLAPFEARFRPVLAHGDPGPHNCLVKACGDLVLIDWDDATVGTIFTDYATLTYWGAHLPHLGQWATRRHAIRRAFWGPSHRALFNLAEIDRIERALHLLHACKMLRHAIEQRDAALAATSHARLTTLLEDPSSGRVGCGEMENGE